MAICCCSLAGTAACRHCNNNPEAESIKTYYIKNNTTYYFDPSELNPSEHSNIIKNNYTLWEPFSIEIEDLPLTTETICPTCGQKIYNRYNFCPNCGTKNNREITK